MNNIVKTIIEYLETQNVDLLISKTTIINRETLNSACFELLAWLKLERKRELWIIEGRKTCLKPLSLNPQYEWCNLLVQIINNEKEFNKTFRVNNNQLTLNNELTNETQSQIRNDAFELYNPQPIIN